ncbi:MAG: ABC transporter ATP-binding protein [Gemmatimonadaceae bacterium]|nr:ABC transporter ATP-binding protein [Gemmatimonadaceae bacterium]
MSTALELHALSVDARPAVGAARAVLREVELTVRPGETVGLLGASGSGKTTLALAVLGLLPPSFDVRGTIQFEGHELRSASRGARRTLLGRRLAMVFQEPLTALNPRLRVGAQVAEVALAHGERDASRAHRAAVEMLTRVGLADADARARRFPHELSGGERQRVLVAMALLLDPALLIADEPTSALDVTVQAQVLTLLREQQRERGMSLVLISHDLGVIASTCERTVVLDGGRVVEDAPTLRLLRTPEHAATRALVDAVRPAERQ